MAYFAKLNENNIVTQVVSVNNNELLDSNGVEQEQKGIDFLNRTFNQSDDIWKQTSFNTREGKHYTNGVLSVDQSKAFRKNYAGVGYTYDHSRDAFIPPKPQGFDSWVLNETSCLWEAPVEYPDDEQMYTWKEDTTSWDLVAD